MKFIKSVSTVSTVLTMALLLSSPSFANVNADIHSSNKLLVEAHKYIKSGQIDKAFDNYQQLIEYYPHTRSAVLSVQAYSDLQPSVISFGIKKDTDRYPQQSVEALLNSVVLAADNGDYRYLAAHLLVVDRTDVTQKMFDDEVVGVSSEEKSHKSFMKFIDGVKLVLKEKTLPSENHSGIEGVEYSNALARFKVIPQPNHIYQLQILVNWTDYKFTTR